MSVADAAAWVSRLPSADLTQDDWLRIGISRGFCTDAVCGTHDGVPVLSDLEAEEWEAGGDPCAPIVRLLE